MKGEVKKSTKVTEQHRMVVLFSTNKKHIVVACKVHWVKEKFLNAGRQI